MRDRCSVAEYSTTVEPDGVRFRFYCAISHALVHISKPFRISTAEEALDLAWDEARPCFNMCHNCGRWVSDTMYNADVLECVDCAPWESEPKFCSRCGYKLIERSVRCPACGSALWYDGSGAHA